MTSSIFFVRHAQPVHGWADNYNRPLTDEGVKDSYLAAELLNDVPLTAAYCSPYRRSMDTIAETARLHGLDIRTDVRLRERDSGPGANTVGMFRKRWEDRDWHEEGGESIRSVEIRNIEVLEEILTRHPGECILVGTHGPALSTIVHHYNPEFGVRDFLRITDWMPYVVRMDFNGLKPVSVTALGHIYKPFGP